MARSAMLLVGSIPSCFRNVKRCCQLSSKRFVRVRNLWSILSLKIIQKSHMRSRKGCVSSQSCSLELWDFWNLCQQEKMSPISSRTCLAKQQAGNLICLPWGPSVCGWWQPSRVGGYHLYGDWHRPSGRCLWWLRCRFGQEHDAAPWQPGWGNMKKNSPWSDKGPVGCFVTGTGKFFCIHKGLKPVDRVVERSRSLISWAHQRLN